MADERDGISWATNAMQAAYDRMEVATNNLANSNSRDFHTVLEKIVATPNGMRAIHSISRENPVMRATGRDWDLAIDGPGMFRVADPAKGNAVSEIRVGAFSTDKEGYIVDPSDRRLLGEHGPIKVGPNAKVRGDGAVIEDEKVIGRIPMTSGSSMRSGFLELSNADTSKAMLQVIDAQRTFETASKVLSAIDATRQKLANETARLKG